MKEDPERIGAVWRTDVRTPIEGSRRILGGRSRRKGGPVKTVAKVTVAP